jgi:hypothetical protein
MLRWNVGMNKHMSLKLKVQGRTAALCALDSGLVASGGFYTL